MRALRIAGSRRLGWTIVVVLAGIYLWLTASGQNPMGRWLHMVFHEPLGMALYLGLALNLVLRALWLLIDRLRAAPPSIEEMDNTAQVEAGEGFDAWLQQNFGIQAADGPVALRRGRLSILPGMLMRLGAALAMMALLLSTHLRAEQTARLLEGESAVLLGKNISLSRLSDALPDEYLAAGDNALFDLKGTRADITVNGTSVALAEGYPAHAAGGYYRLIGLGYRQAITVGEGGDVLEVGGHLDLLPPGRAVNIVVPPGDTVLTMRLAPGRTVQKGLITGEVYDLRKPRYELSLKCGAAEAESTVLHGGGHAVIAGIPVALGKTGVSVEVLAVDDPALLWLKAGLWMALAGLVFMPLRLFWYVKEVRVERESGTARIGYTEEFYKKWAEVRFETRMRELEGR